MKEGNQGKQGERGGLSRAGIAVLGLLLAAGSWLGWAGTAHAATPITGLEAAVASANASNPVITLANGVYDYGTTYEELLLSNYTGANIVIKPETKGGVTFKGEVTLLLKGRNITLQDFKFDNTHAANTLKLQDCQGCTVKNNYFVNAGHDAYLTGGSPPHSYAYGAYSHLIRMVAGSDSTKVSKNNTITGNTFENLRSMGVGIVNDTGVNKGNTNNRIANNYFKNIAHVDVVWSNQTGGNGMEAVQIGQNFGGTPAPQQENVLGAIVEKNYFDNVASDGNEIISVKTSGNTIRANTFRNCPGYITLRMGNNNVVDGNFFIQTKGGMRVYGDNHTIKNNYFQNVKESAIKMEANGSSSHIAGTDVKIVNNSIFMYDAANTAAAGIKLLGGTNTKVYNNFIRTATEPAFWIPSSGPTGTAFGKNIVNATGTGTIVETGQTAPSVTTTSVSLYKDAADLYRPSNTGTNPVQTLSGVTTYGVTADMDGQARSDGTIDIGSDEISSGTVVYRVFSSADVGTAVGKDW